MLGADRLARQRFLIVGAAAQAETGAFERRAAGRGVNRFADGAQKTFAAFAGSGMIAGTRAADADDLSRLIAGDRGRTRLSTIDTQKKSHGRILNNVAPGTAATALNPQS